MGGYPDLNREHIVPHTIALPIELYPPKIFHYIILYLEVIRTPNVKHQKFMTYLLVYEILCYFQKWYIYTK
jgi:hypothetical protein